MTDLTFQDELRLSPINLPRTALRLAQEIAYPQLNTDYYLKRLDKLANAAWQAVPQAAPVLYRASALAEYLFHQSGFRGNEANYGDPRNSYLNEVLDRRLGIPLTLSLVFVAVARRLQLPAYGVGLPGHFIAAVREEQTVWFFDPFHGGERLSVGDCARLVRQTAGYEGPFDEGWLAPAEPRDILARLLNNLRIVYVQREAWQEALAVLEHMWLVQPDRPQLLRDMGLIHFEMGDMWRATGYLEKYFKQAPGAVDAAVVRQRVAIGLGNWVRMN
jgi:regulator of sirC expression with transglutaminase-like and TPR domain